MRLAVLGASSQIAKDMVLAFSRESGHDLRLFARRPDVVEQWMGAEGLTGRYTVADFGAFDVGDHYDALFNFVGVGNPAQAKAMGASIFDVTLKYDELALDYVRQHPTCKYLFLSSGAAYGSNFDEPANANTKAAIAINNLLPQDWYAVAKLYAECRHRAQPELPIVDIRVFNYVSRTQDMTARFLIADIMRAIRDNTVLKTSADYIVRDYLHPSDFYALVCALLNAPAENAAVDCYTLAPIDKPNLLTSMHEEFGLRYEVSTAVASINATGNKPHYYSTNTRAAGFGYQPSLTSIAGIQQEMRSFLVGSSITRG